MFSQSNRLARDLHPSCKEGNLRLGVPAAVPSSLKAEWAERFGLVEPGLGQPGRAEYGLVDGGKMNVEEILAAFGYASVDDAVGVARLAEAQRRPKTQPDVGQVDQREFDFADWGAVDEELSQVSSSCQTQA